MLALFSLKIEPDGTRSHSDGSLFSLPPELCDMYRLNQYYSISSQGWSVSEFGYLCYQRTTKSGTRHILPGLYLTDGPKPKKKFHGYRPILSKRDVEAYVASHIDRNEGFMQQAEQEMTALVHDLRHLSSAIYHSTEQAQRAFRQDDRSELSEGLKTIVATQTMLRVRIDYLDYVSGVDRFEDDTKITVFSRVDKVVRCFTATANDKAVRLNLRGQSFRITRGPNILDIVPYSIIDNAIKYSPKNCDVTVSVFDTADRTTVSVASMGPCLGEEEFETVFERSVRGKNAAKLRPSGTGLGLAVAKDIIEVFGGEISVKPSGEVSLFDEVPHQNIEFRFSVPTFGEDLVRARRFQNRRSRRISKA